MEGEAPGGTAIGGGDGALSALAGRVERLRTVLEITKLLNTERDLDRLLDLIVSRAAEVMDAERGSIFLLDPRANELTCRTGTGVQAGELRFDARKGLAGHILGTGETVNIPDVYADPRFYPEIDRRTGFRTRSLLGCPLLGAGGERMGVFQALNKRSGPAFDREDEELLAVLAAQAGIAIDNARDLHRAKGQTERFARANAAMREMVVAAFVGESGPAREVRDLARQVAATSVSVLLTGESGTGKSHVARLIHYEGERADRPFVSINCAAIPEGLVESELFGIERGVATGVDQKAGKIELADTGTLFLDEIGDMSEAVQAKILHAIQDKEVTRVGGRRPRRVDVRWISATNRDIEAEVKEGRFREDLYFRLNVLRIHCPPLRERPGDIPLLARHHLARFAAEQHKRTAGIAKEAMERLLAYPWPGNVRELENELQRAVALAAPDAAIGLDLLSPRVRGEERGGRPGLFGAGCPLTPTELLKEAVEDLERAMIERALARTGGNRLRAAKLLGISREGLRKKMARYGLERRT